MKLVRIQSNTNDVSIIQMDAFSNAQNHLGSHGISASIENAQKEGKIISH